MLEVTAPSIEIATAMILHVTAPKKLVEVMIGLCPEAELDDEDGGNHVLVMQ